MSQLVLEHKEIDDHLTSKLLPRGQSNFLKNKPPQTQQNLFLGSLGLCAPLVTQHTEVCIYQKLEVALLSSFPGLSETTENAFAGMPPKQSSCSEDLEGPRCGCS